MFKRDDFGNDLELVDLEDARDKGLKRYFTGVPCKHGHVSERFTSSRGCLVCAYSRHKKYYHANRDTRLKYCKEWLKSNSEHVKEYNSKYYVENRDTRLTNNKVWRDKNKEYRKNYHKEYRKDNAEVISNNKRTRYNEDEKFRLSEIYRAMLRRVLSKVGKEKEQTSHAILGYTPKELMESLEDKFLTGMSWENYPNEWQIDHIYSVSYLVMCGVDDPAIINSLENLLPMWKGDNSKKSGTPLHILEDCHPDLFETYRVHLQKVLDKGIKSAYNDTYIPKSAEVNDYE